MLTFNMYWRIVRVEGQQVIADGRDEIGVL
jgi:hypothetical protein